MNKWIAILLALVSVDAVADWTPIYKNAKFTTYFDRQSIRINGRMTRIVTINDYIAPFEILRGKFAWSMRAYAEYDCVEPKSRFLTFTSYTGNMGQGTAETFAPWEGKWMSIERGSSGDAIWQTACQKE